MKKNNLKSNLSEHLKEQPTSSFSKNVMQQIQEEAFLKTHLKMALIQKAPSDFKAKVLQDHKADGTDDTFQEAIDDEQTIVFTDKSTSYVNIADYVEIHMTEKSNEQTTKETLKWVHIAISNAKRNFVGTYHKIKKKYLQLYLNEFVYKLNRRYFGERIFDRLVVASITASGH